MEAVKTLVPPPAPSGAGASESGPAEGGLGSGLAKGRRVAGNACKFSHKKSAVVGVVVGSICNVAVAD